MRMHRVSRDQAMRDSEPLSLGAKRHVAAAPMQQPEIASSIEQDAKCRQHRIAVFLRSDTAAEKYYLAGVGKTAFLFERALRTRARLKERKIHAVNRNEIDWGLAAVSADGIAKMIARDQIAMRDFRIQTRSRLEQLELPASIRLARLRVVLAASIVSLDRTDYYHRGRKR